MKITWYGHSAFRLDFGRHAVLIDPYFTGNPAFVSDPAVAMRGASHVLLTHGHSDHVGDTIDIARKTGAAAAARPTPMSAFPLAPKHHSKAARTLLSPAKCGARSVLVDKVDHSIRACSSHRR